jgi:hypothetical protein
MLRAWRPVAVWPVLALDKPKGTFHPGSAPPSHGLLHVPRLGDRGGFRRRATDDRRPEFQRMIDAAATKLPGPM